MRAKELLSEAVRVNVSDPSAKEYLTKACELLADHLGISNHNILVTFDVNLPTKGHHGLTAPSPQHPDTINVLIGKGLTRADMLYALAHEMVHAKQIDSGRMRFEFSKEGIQPYWDDKPVPLKYNRNADWENEAHANEKDLARMVIGEIGNLQ